MIEKPPEVNFLQLYIPANPFFSLANNIVPAVVVFSIAVGVALIGAANKMTLIEPLTILSGALMKVTTVIAKLTPYGVFAIVASTAGTMGLEELGRLQVFLITYMVLALLLTFGILPIMVTSLTPLSYRQVVGQTRDVLITAFATGSGLIVLPLMIERTRDLLRTGHLGDEETQALPDVIIPAFFNFPKIGTLLPMSFVLFAGWFSGATVSVAQYPIFITSGLASFFGSVNVAIPFLLDLLRIPSDMFQLYLATSVITGRFGVLLAVMHSLILALPGSCAVSGLLSLRWDRLVRNLVLSVAVTIVALMGCRLLFNLIFDNTYDKDKIVASMQLLRHPGPATIHTAADPPPPLPPLALPSRLDRIRQRGILRAGYRANALPNSYFNGAGELVGFDIDMAYVLAKDLKVELEFVPVETAKMAEQLDHGYCDIIMSGVAITPERALEMAFSRPLSRRNIGAVGQRPSPRRISPPGGAQTHAATAARHPGRALLHRQNQELPAAGRDDDDTIGANLLRRTGRSIRRPGVFSRGGLCLESALSIIHRCGPTAAHGGDSHGLSHRERRPGDGFLHQQLARPQKGRWHHPVLLRLLDLGTGRRAGRTTLVGYP